jgi:spermidine/putrescine ABC transporter ATP-binding subunit
MVKAPSEKSHFGVEIENVTKHYGSVLAVDGVSLEINEGEFVTLLGPSGCGKSTLLRLISGFIEPSAGDIRLNGKSLIGIPPYRRNSSMVFQDYALFPHRTVAQNLAFGLRMRKLAKPEIAVRVEQMLELLGLGGMGNRRPSEISGGQAQRAALGRALIVEPAVLLLDEPLGALDLKLRKQMQGELKRIQRQVGVTFIYVTHDQEEALTMSDRIAVMRAGKVEQFATPETIYRRPASTFVADFVGDANLLNCRVVRTPEGATLVTALGARVAVLAGVLANLRVGSEATVVLRPEDLSLTSASDSAAGVICGTVESVSFSGPTAQVVVSFEDGSRLAAAIKSSTPLPAKGQLVGIEWNAEDAVVLASRA